MGDLRVSGLEIWKPVVGYEGSYEVSNLGRVRSLDRIVPVNSGKGPNRTYMKRLRGKVLALQKHPGGYRQVALCGRIYLVHDLVLQAFVGPRPPGKEGCHNDSDKRNNALSNLRYDTHTANCADRIANGVIVEGVLNPQAKITDEDVAAIRRLNGVLKQDDIAAAFDISQAQVSRIITRKQWDHV